MPPLERREDLAQHGIGPDLGVDRNVLFVVLAGVTHADGAQDLGRTGEALLAQFGHGLVDEPGEVLLNRCRVDIARAEALAMDLVDLEIGDEGAEGRAEAGIERQDDARHVHLARQGAGMQGTGAAESDESEIPGVEPAVDRQDADRVRHVLVGHVDDGLRRVRHLQVQLPSHQTYRALRGAQIELHLSAQEVRGIEAPENEVGVGHCRIPPTLAVTCRPRLGAGAPRADPQEAAFVDPGDAAAAGANGGEVDARRGDRQAPLDLEIRRVADLAVADDPDVTARAAHIERDQLALASLLAEERAADDAAAQSREQQLDRLRLGRSRHGVAAVRLHQRPWRTQRHRLEAPPNIVDVGADRRLDIGIGDDRAAALVFPPDRRHRVRERYRHVGKAPAQECAEPQLVHGVDVGEQQADRDRRAAFIAAGQKPGDRVRHCLEPGVVQRRQDFTVVAEPLRYPDAVATLHQRFGFRPFQRVVIAAVHPLDERDVLESRRRQKDNLRSLALEQCVGRDGRADDQELDRLVGDPAGAERVGDRLDRVARRRGCLAEHETARGLVEPDEVGERSAGVDADPDAHRTPPLAFITAATILRYARFSPLSLLRVISLSRRSCARGVARSGPRTRFACAGPCRAGHGSQPIGSRLLPVSDSCI